MSSTSTKIPNPIVIVFPSRFYYKMRHTVSWKWIDYSYQFQSGAVVMISVKDLKTVFSMLNPLTFTMSILNIWFII